MAMTDPWAREWFAYNGSGPGWPYLGPGSFTLSSILHPTSGQVAYYRVAAIGSGMQKCWQGIQLVPRGNRQAPTPPGPQLKPWNSNNDVDWQSDADWVRQQIAMPTGINPTIQRLEADIYPKTDAEALTLIRIPDIVNDGTDLLVLMLVSSPVHYRPREDGTAHGGSGPPHIQSARP
jgi:hypothetical protein